MEFTELVPSRLMSMFSPSRALFRQGVNFVSVKPSNVASAWEIKQEMLPGSTSLSVFCQRKSVSTGERPHCKWATSVSHCIGHAGR
ncbi:hypothetical protein DPEC_G00119930 [Dallia pectoralis]|uniref:Uncharacterized protein n=1 Tax=Dallia pectoralis TaxID=75939 RepID=A0ACC2GQC9_DALPE|nr:hypothetical protein DPEC_G00119930 [Dallia pectoralis]